MMKRSLLLVFLFLHQCDAFVAPRVTYGFASTLEQTAPPILLQQPGLQQLQLQQQQSQTKCSRIASLHSHKTKKSDILEEINSKPSIATKVTSSTRNSNAQEIDEETNAISKPVGLPFFHVNWSSMPVLSSKRSASNASADKLTKTSNMARDLSVSSRLKDSDSDLQTSDTRLTPSPFPPQRQDDNQTQTNATFFQNISSDQALKSSSNRTVTPVVPVAETILRTIYGKASESTELAWNMSMQLFPLAADLTSITNGNLTLATAGKKSSDLLTLQDLERILLENGFVRQIDVAAALQRDNYNLRSAASEKSSIDGVGQPVSDMIRGRKKDLTLTTSESTVAWPQPSVLSYGSLKWGVTAASAISCMVLAASVLPSLWLVGGLVGSLYGHQTGKRLSDGTVPKSFFPAFMLVFGKRIAKSYLQVYDMVNAMFFMYKTGQLSYDMYKRYASLDERFRIQDKIDAWNAVFVEGKENFDKWEKENEVGRKVLATLRTVWLVEERSLKKKGLRRVQKRSRYRMVQLIYDGAYLAGRFVANLWRFVSGGGSSEELSELLRGVRLDISKSRLDEIGSRIGACIAALIAVNIIGAVFAISPVFLGLLAVLAGLVWPTWLSELLARTQRLVEDTRATGRGEEVKPKRGTRTVDKKRYSYYIAQDGRKRYYRVTQSPLFRNRDDKIKNGFRWPWQKPKEPERSSWFDFGL